MAIETRSWASAELKVTYIGAIQQCQSLEELAKLEKDFNYFYFEVGDHVKRAFERRLNDFCKEVK